MSDSRAIELRDVYAAVAARRTAFDNMLWQVPVLSFTAQAFLFSIALSPDASRAARVITSVLALLVSFLAIHLLTRHRQAEVADGEWLGKVETDHADTPAGLNWPMHGPSWRTYRNATSPGVASGWNWLAKLGGYAVWSWGMLLFGVAALVVVTLTLFAPSHLSGDQGSGNSHDHRISDHHHGPPPRR